MQQMNNVSCRISTSVGKGKNRGWCSSSMRTGVRAMCTKAEGRSRNGWHFWCRRWYQLIAMTATRRDGGAIRPLCAWDVTADMVDSVPHPLMPWSVTWVKKGCLGQWREWRKGGCVKSIQKSDDTASHINESAEINWMNNNFNKFSERKLFIGYFLSLQLAATAFKYDAGNSGVDGTPWGKHSPRPVRLLVGVSSVRH